MKKLLVILLIITVVAVYSIFNQAMLYYIEDSNENPEKYSNASYYDVDEIKLTNLINHRRVKAGKEPYIKDRYLCGWAGDRLEQVRISFTHDGFLEGVDKVYSETKFMGLAENLSMFYTTEEETLQGWENSPKHKEALDKDYTHACIRCDYGYCVNLFGIY